MQYSKTFRDKLLKVLTDDDRNGVYFDEDCYIEGTPRWTDEQIEEQYVTAALDDISGLVAAGKIPTGPHTFSELHDFVDANMLGLAEQVDFDTSDESLYFWNRVQEAVGKHMEALPKHDAGTITAESLKDVWRGDRVTINKQGYETFQLVSAAGRAWFVSLRYGHEYTRPQLVRKYEGGEYEIKRIPEHGWPL